MIICIYDFCHIFCRLYNLEPDRSVTGGAWYSDQDFESEFVEILNQQCYRFLQQKQETSKKSLAGPLAARNMSLVPSTDVHKFISDLVNTFLIFVKMIWHIEKMCDWSIRNGFLVISFLATQNNLGKHLKKIAVYVYQIPVKTSLMNMNH